MSWKDEIRKKDDLEKRYEIAYQNFESEAEDFLLQLRDVMNTDYHNNAIRDAQTVLGRFERAYGNMKNILNRVADRDN
tara:strand:+ start:331 stop:564 length:234 start_codon:yes stop_codon:yes gene_type:complete